MNLAVDASIIEKFPHLRIGYLVATDVSNVGRSTELEQQFAGAEAAFRAQFASEAALDADPRILAWRDVYRSFGVNPKRARPSAEALLRRIMKGTSVRWTSRAVNAYLLPQLEIPLPVGGYDLDQLDGTVRLRFSAGGEPFLGIQASEEERTEAGEVVYADASRVLTRRWNFRDCDHAKITEESRRIALFVEAPVPGISVEDVRKLIQRISQLLQQYCRAQVSTGMLEPQSGREFSLPL